MTKDMFRLMVVVGAFLCSGRSYGQIADPHCYYPNFDDVTQVDTIYGSYTDQQLGDFFRLPPIPGETKSRLAIADLKKSNYRYSVINPNTLFNIHSPKFSDSLRVDRDAGGSASLKYYGHFRNSRDLDLFTPLDGIIYWADEKGLYDTSRKRYLGFDFKNGNYTAGSIGTLSPIVTHFSSDTIDDIFWGVTTITTKDSVEKDTCFLIHYPGGAEMTAGANSILPDSKMLFDTGYDPILRDFISGNFRGTGNIDFVGYHRDDNLFFYRNDGKFDPVEFIRAMHEDTLVAAWQQHLNEKDINDNKIQFENAQAERVLSKPEYDSSTDLIFMYVLPALNGHGGTIGHFAFLKGGPGFGSTRIQLDTVATIRDLGTIEAAYSNYSPHANFFIGQIDHSPNANKFILIHYSEELLYEHYFLYMLGDAFDDQADMIFEVPYPYYRIWYYDTVDANGDGFTDILFGAPFYTSSKSSESNVGTMGVIYGTPLIPHLTKSAVSESISSDYYCRVLTMPEKKVRIEYFVGENVSEILEVRDILGRLVLKKSLFLENKGSFTLDLLNLSIGTYVLTLEGKKVFSNKKIFVTY